MKKFPLILFLVCFIFQVNSQNLYEDALIAASYAYSHSKKAHGSNNVFHTQEYADKAIEAFEIVEDLTDKCGCAKANETAYEAKTKMINSLKQDTYERSRYYAKQAKELSPKLLKQLTNCQINHNSFTNIHVEEMVNTVAVAVTTEKKSRKQQKLQQQITAQQKHQEEFKKQSAVKVKTEQTLQKLESVLLELNIAFDNQSILESQKDYLRTEIDLQNETVNDTKKFYVNRAKELTKIVMQQFVGYTKN